MLAILTMLVILSLSIVVTRIASIALAYTGLSRQTARFQARSAFTGVGFTTRESEKVVGHPVRRRILMLLMLLGNAGIVTAVTTLIVGFIGGKAAFPLWARVGLLMAGVAALWTVATSDRVDRLLSRAVNWALERYTDLDIKDYKGLLHLGGDFNVAELQVLEGDWLADKTLNQVRLREEGVMVLGVARPDGAYLGAPDGETLVEAGDVLVLYGRAPVLQNLDFRPKGEEGAYEHAGAKAEQRQVKAKEKEMDKERRQDE